jgi:hypothetical protein
MSVMVPVIPERRRVGVRRGGRRGIADGDGGGIAEDLGVHGYGQDCGHGYCEGQTQGASHGIASSIDS